RPRGDAPGEGCLRSRGSREPGQGLPHAEPLPRVLVGGDRKSTRLNSSHGSISYAVFCLKKKKKKTKTNNTKCHYPLDRIKNTVTIAKTHGYMHTNAEVCTQFTIRPTPKLSRSAESHTLN